LSYAELHKVRAIQFGLLSAKEVAQLQVVRIDNKLIYNNKGEPEPNGINDPHMGTMDKDVKCYTCKNSK
jgi:DNA-directed RNA polymerase II subunit RPB1